MLCTLPQVSEERAITFCFLNVAWSPNSPRIRCMKKYNFLCRETGSQWSHSLIPPLGRVTRCNIYHYQERYMKCSELPHRDQNDTNAIKSKDAYIYTSYTFICIAQGYGQRRNHENNFKIERFVPRNLNLHLCYIYFMSNLYYILIQWKLTFWISFAQLRVN